MSGIRGTQLYAVMLRILEGLARTPEACACSPKVERVAVGDVPAPPSTVEAFKKTPITPRDQRLDEALRKGISPIKEKK